MPCMSRLLFAIAIAVVAGLFVPSILLVLHVLFFIPAIVLTSTIHMFCVCASAYVSLFLFCFILYSI
eukprot:m.344895 g.344895  ORF g.344895 m.344895 type:complete len:67 (+) comp16138_c0_seq1:16-216(+)